jgi:hypothetical protein
VAAVKIRSTRSGQTLLDGCRLGRPDPLGAGHAGQPERPHQATDLIAADGLALTAQLAPQLAGAVYPEVDGVDPPDGGAELGVADGPGAGRPDLGRVVRGWGNLQDSADRLDSPTSPLLVDEGGHRGERRSSSTPKKAAALLRISLARRSSRISRSMVFMTPFSKRWSLHQTQYGSNLMFITGRLNSKQSNFGWDEKRAVLNERSTLLVSAKVRAGSLGRACHPRALAGTWRPRVCLDRVSDRRCDEDPMVLSGRHRRPVICIEDWLRVW